MKSAIFYAATERPGRPSEYTPCCAKDCFGKAYVFWVRVVIVAADALHALDMAKPRPGETVLNTVELP